MLLIRGTSLTGYVEFVDELGGNGARILDRFGIPVESVGDFGSFVSFAAVLEAIETAAAVTATPDFGRRLAMRQDIEILGPVGAAARTAPTVGKALATVQRYLRAYTPATTPILEPVGSGLVRFHLRRNLPGSPPYPQATEVGLGISLRVVRTFVGHGWHPVLVELAHQPLGDPDSYQPHYEAPARFGQPVTGFLMNAADLELPLSTDSETHETLVRHLQAMSPYQPQTTVPMVHDLVRRLLPGGRVDLATVADEMGLHPRTLQRRLEDEGVTFAELVQSVRRSTAERYLRDTDMPLGHLASELGYLEQSAFTRASRRWFGMSPLAYRRELQTAGA